MQQVDFNALHEMMLAGFVFTIRSNADPTLAGELEDRVRMLDEIKPNDVCIWNANGDDGASHWGHDPGIESARLPRCDYRRRYA